MVLICEKFIDEEKKISCNWYESYEIFLAKNFGNLSSGIIKEDANPVVIMCRLAPNLAHCRCLKILE